MLSACISIKEYIAKRNRASGNHATECILGKRPLKHETQDDQLRRVSISGSSTRVAANEFVKSLFLIFAQTNNVHDSQSLNVPATCYIVRSQRHLSDNVTEIRQDRGKLARDASKGTSIGVEGSGDQGTCRPDRLHSHARYSITRKIRKYR